MKELTDIIGLHYYVYLTAKNTWAIYNLNWWYDARVYHINLPQGVGIPVDDPE